MLNKKIFLVIFILLCSYLTFHYLHHKSGPLEEITIVLDAGHGGKDEGAKGYSGTLEKNLNLKTTKLLRDKLESFGAKVLLPRDGDTYLTLTERVNFTTKKDADLFISIHYNSSPSTKPEGLTTFYFHEQKDKALATNIHNHLLKVTNNTNRGVLFGDYYVLRENSIPSVLLELGFISNQNEEQQMITNHYQNKITSAIAEAILEFVASDDYLLSKISVTGPSLINETSILAPNLPVSTAT